MSKKMKYTPTDLRKRPLLTRSMKELKKEDADFLIDETVLKDVKDALQIKKSEDTLKRIFNELAAEAIIKDAGELLSPLKRVKIAILDDELGLQKDLRGFSNRFPQYQLIWNISYGSMSFGEIIPTEVPDIILFDIQTNDFNQYKVLSRLKDAYPETRFIWTATCEDEDFIADIYALGVLEYINKEPAFEKLLSLFEQPTKHNSLRKLLIDTVNKRIKNEERYENNFLLQNKRGNHALAIC